MYEWKCKYCNSLFYASGLCVYHENSECLKNPKFIYSIQNLENGDLNKYREKVIKFDVKLEKVKNKCLSVS